MEDRIPCPYPECKEKSHPAVAKYCPYTGKPIPPSSSQSLNSTKNSLAAEIINILKECKNENSIVWENLHIFPNIPPRKEKNAAKRFRLSKDKDEIIGIMDITIFGSARNCLVFGQKGIYFHNSRLGKKPGSWELLYKDFKNRTFEIGYEGQISLGDNLFLDMSLFDNLEKNKGIVGILNSIKSSFCTKNKTNAPLKKILKAKKRKKKKKRTKK